MGQGRTIGRYVLYDEIGVGGMATVHVGRLLGTAGFSRTVAIKRLHPHCSRDPRFVTLFLDEARVTGRIQHPNVAAMLDVVKADDELLLVMEYIHGEPLSRLTMLARHAGSHIAPRIAVSIAIDVLRGLHAAHEAKTELGEPLGIIHRDVTPQNVLVGADGVTRLVDFGVAKAASRLQVTGEGQIKGKFPYMAPEQIQGHALDRRVDVYAASVVLWETLAMRRLFTADNPANVITRVLEMDVEPPSAFAKDIPKALDEVVMRGLSRDATERFATAEDMAHALEVALSPATVREVSEWVRSIATEQLAVRSQLLSSIESAPPPEAGLENDPPKAQQPAPLEASQISNISVTVGTRRTTTQKTVAAALAAGALLVGLAVFAVARSKGSSAVVAGAPAPTDASVMSAVPVVVSRAPITLPTISATAHAPRTVVHLQPAANTNANASSSARPACNPPYTVDPSDPRIHVAKPECL
jgi:eukaryotic-like serine/threonine-protein kinase